MTVVALASSLGITILIVIAFLVTSTQGLLTLEVFLFLFILVLGIAALIFLFAFRLFIALPLRQLERIIRLQESDSEISYLELKKFQDRRDIIGALARLFERSDTVLRKNLENQRTASQRLEAEVTQRTQELWLYKQIMHDTGEGIIVTDPTGVILEVNPAFAHLTGYHPENLVGAPVSLLISNREPPNYYRRLLINLRKTSRWEGEFWISRKDGSSAPTWLTIDSIRDLEGRVQRYIGFFVDISKLKIAEESLHKLAFFDPLTELPNRSLFMDRISHALSRAQRTQSRLALLYLDLDHFKDVNDAYGHQVGDQLLIETARRLLSQVRDVDTVCRLGGDEFTIILESITQSSDASLVAKKIVDSLRPSFFINGQEIYAPASVGIALYPYDGKTVDELVKNADAAMYEAKDAGRGQFRFASGAAGKSSKHRLEMEALLRRALKKDKFVINFQPQVSTGSAIFGSNRGLVGAEALIRMGDKDERILPPDRFIEIAEDTGLIVPMGEWMLFQACAEAKRWAETGRPIPVAVNVSQRQFEKGVVVQQTEAALAASGLKPELLKLEITESLFMRDLQRSVKVMQALKEMGVSFAIDDFGTGYSSLRYLDSLPIDILKIDKSFIDRISSNQENGAVAMAVVSLARSFGLISIAEGVETQEQLDALKMRGCDTIQGYFISKPLDSQEFYGFLTDTAVKVPMQELRFSGGDSQLEELETVL